MTVDFLIVLIRVIHTAILGFVLLAWAIPNSVAWKVHIILIPVMVLHWRTNQNKCFLTDIENWLRKKKERPVIESFVKSLIGNILTHKQREICIQVIVWMSWLACVLNELM